MKPHHSSRVALAPKGAMTGAIARDALVVVVLALLLAACTTSRTGPPPSVAAAPPPSTADVTNAPVDGGVNIQPGSEEDLMVNVGRRTFFAESSAALDQTAKVTLDKQADWLVQFPQWKVKIQGFADDPGSEGRNVEISKQRAEAVKQYLVSKGIASGRIYAKGYGRDRLIQDCADISCKAQNRRVITNPQDTPET